MEATQEQMAPDSTAVLMPGLAAPARPRHTLPPKGSCWYCEKPLDSVKRFCGKDCAASFDEESRYTG